MDNPSLEVIIELLLFIKLGLNGGKEKGEGHNDVLKLEKLFFLKKDMIIFLLVI